MALLQVEANMAKDKGNKGGETKSPELLALEAAAQSPEALAADQARLRAAIPDDMRGGVKRPFQEGVKLIPNTFPRDREEFESMLANDPALRHLIAELLGTVFEERSTAVEAPEHQARIQKKLEQAIAGYPISEKGFRCPHQKCGSRTCTVIYIHGEMYGKINRFKFYICDGCSSLFQDPERYTTRGGFYGGC